jgi:tRNA threonylcarbamoyl adenosine modification protein (Sua5/YciO/YrdC/YwlC family)
MGDAALEAAAQAIAAGQCIVIPTDTVYGIAADPFSATAVQRLQDAKGRGDGFPPPLLVADVTDVDPLVADFPEPARRLARYWPGPLTLIFRAATTASLAGTIGTIGIRVPDHEWTRSLLRKTGPLAVSSANLHGLPAASTVHGAMHQFQTAESPALYIDGGTTGFPAPSTVVDFSGEAMVIRRVGVLTTDDIEAVASDA